MNFYFSKYKIFNLIFLSVFFLNACKKQEIPEYRPKDEIKVKTLYFSFIDKSDPTANIAIYINNNLLGTSFQRFNIPESLTGHTLTITLAEYEAGNPPAKLQLANLIYETFILPSELSAINNVAFSRDNAGSPIELSKIGVSATETSPDPGYFKIRFYNLSNNKIDVLRRNGSGYKEFADLNVVEERIYQQLPFGPYHFVFQNQAKGNIFSPITFKGESGKIYDILITNDASYAVDVKDYGVPQTNFAYLGFVNLLPKQPQVWVLPVRGSKRTESSPKVYTKFDGVELVPSGSQNITVEIGQEKLTATYDLKPYDYLMIYIVDNNGKPELQLVPTPLTEPEPDRILTRFLNFSSDTGKVSFARIRTDLILNGAAEEPSTILNSDFAANLKFGEVRSKNGIYTSDGALIIQAFKATGDIARLGEPIPNARIDYPFFINKPKVPIANYKGNPTEAGTYTVLLSGNSNESNPELRAKITVICHSF